MPFLSLLLSLFTLTDKGAVMHTLIGYNYQRATVVLFKDYAFEFKLLIDFNYTRKLCERFVKK